MVSRKIVVTVLALLVAGAAWAYVDRSGGTASAAQQQVGPAELSSRLPFSRILYAPTEAKWRIAEAEQRLTTACMAKAGFSYRPAAIPKPAEVTEESQMPFGLEYLGSPGSAASAGPSETRESKAFSLALYGNPNDRISASGKLIKVSWPAEGCQAEAEKQLVGTGRQQLLQVTIQLDEGEQQARQLLEQDPAFEAANARWAQCALKAGVRAKDPVGLLKSLPRGIDYSSNEAAQVDVRCKEDTDYLRTAYTRLAAVQQTWLDAHAGELASWNSLQQRQDTAARVVLHTP